MPEKKGSRGEARRPEKGKREPERSKRERSNLGGTSRKRKGLTDIQEVRMKKNAGGRPGKNQKKQKKYNPNALPNAAGASAREDAENRWSMREKKSGTDRHSLEKN